MTVRLIWLFALYFLFGSAAFAAPPQAPAPVPSAQPSAEAPVPAKLALPQLEYAVEVRGFRQFEDLKKVEVQLGQSLPDGSLLHEKEASRGRVVLLVRTSLSEQEMILLLSQTASQLGAQGLRVSVQGNARPYLLEIQP